MPFQPRSNIVQTLFHLIGCHIWPNHEIATFGPFWALEGPKYVKYLVQELDRRSAHIVGPEKTIDDSNELLSQNAYVSLSDPESMTFLNGLPGIGRQLCIKMWFWHFSTHKIYVTVRGKFSEAHFGAFFFSNPGEKV